MRCGGTGVEGGGQCVREDLMCDSIDDCDNLFDELHCGLCHG